MKDTLNIGIIGLGEIGQAHCDAFSQVGRARLVAVSDVDQTRLAETTARTKTRGYVDYRELLAHRDLDAVVIATPEQAHAIPCVLAAEAGKHILVEKPIATTLRDAENIIEAADAARVKLMVGFTLRFFPQYIYAKQSVERGDLGQLVSVFARRTNLITRQEKMKGRTGVLNFLGVHDFDVMRWIIGSEPESIFCEQATSVPSAYPVENETFAIIRFQNGVIGCGHFGWFLPENHPAGFDFKLDLTGTNGVLHLDMIRQGVEIDTHQTHYPYLAAPLIAEAKAFVDSVLDNTPVPATGIDGLRATKMVIAAQESLQSHLPVTL